MKTGGFLVPQRAVTVGAQGGTIMVVGPKNIAEPREVKLGELQGGNWIVRSGLKAGDRVIVMGMHKLQQGKPIRIDQSQATSMRGAQTQQKCQDNHMGTRFFID